MLKYLSVIKRAYDALMKCPADVRERVLTRFREARDSGALPIGTEKDPDGKETLLWLVFDRTKIKSAAELDRYMRARTPAGVDFTVVVL